MTRPRWPRGRAVAGAIGWFSALLLAGPLLVALALAAPLARAAPLTPEPLDAIALASLGYQDTTLRGPTVSGDFYLPGPGEFRLAEDNWLDLDVLPSDLLTPESTMTVLWNGIPLRDVRIGGAPGTMRLTIPLPRDRVDPNVNRLQVQGFLQTTTQVCVVEENPARHLTIFKSSQVRYSYVDRQPHPRPVTPDLARYPAPFLTPDAPQPAPVLLILPAAPDSVELTAAARIAALLGQAAGSRGARLDAAVDEQLDPARLAASHLIFVGRRAELPTLGDLQAAPIRTGPGGGYVDGSGAPVEATTGVVFETPSPWNPGRMALVATGADDAAVERAALLLASGEGTRSAQGALALVTDVRPAPPDPLAGPRTVTLADLGRKDDSVSGVGDHRFAFTVDLPALDRRTDVPFEVVTSHSPLLDQQRSSFRVVLNGVPLAATSFRDVDPVRGRVRVLLPAASLRPGPNAVAVEMTLRLPPLSADQGCPSVPSEQAWAVLHADSSFQQPPADTTLRPSVSLADYPYPFVREGRLDDTVIVVPDSPTYLAPLVRLAADLGRSARGAVLAPRVLRASEFDPADAESKRDAVVLGLPGDTPLLAQLDGHLPIQLDADQRLVVARDLTVGVRDTSRLGVLEAVASPWAPDRGLLVVTGSSPEGLALAVEALRQGSLSGNAAVVSQPPAPVAAPDATPTPAPVAIGGPPAVPLQVSTYRIRPRIEPPAPRPPYGLAASAAAAVVAILVAGGLAYRAFARGRPPREDE